MLGIRNWWGIESHNCYLVFSDVPDSIEIYTTIPYVFVIFDTSPCFGTVLCGLYTLCLWGNMQTIYTWLIIDSPLSATQHWNLHEKRNNHSFFLVVFCPYFRIYFSLYFYHYSEFHTVTILVEKIPQVFLTKLSDFYANSIILLYLPMHFVRLHTVLFLGLWCHIVFQERKLHRGRNWLNVRLFYL